MLKATGVKEWYEKADGFNGRYRLLEKGQSHCVFVP
jgi:hypothetical protein